MLGSPLEANRARAGWSLARYAMLGLQSVEEHTSSAASILSAIIGFHSLHCALQSSADTDFEAS